MAHGEEPASLGAMRSAVELSCGRGVLCLLEHARRCRMRWIALRMLGGLG
jgi:hypothetical protein